MAEAVQHQGAGAEDLAGPAQTYDTKQTNKWRRILKSGIYPNMNWKDIEQWFKKMLFTSEDHMNNSQFSRMDEVKKKKR